MVTSETGIEDLMKEDLHPFEKTEAEIESDGTRAIRETIFEDGDNRHLKLEVAHQIMAAAETPEIHL